MRRIRIYFGLFLAVLFGTLNLVKFIIDTVGRTTFFEDFDALQQRLYPVLTWIAKQPEIAFYGTSVALMLFGVLLAFMGGRNRTTFDFSGDD